MLALGSVVLITVVVSLSAVFATARSSAEVAADGTRGIFGEAALSAAATTRNRAIQAVLIATAADLGLSNEAEATAAADAARRGLVELDNRIRRLEAETETSSAKARLITQHEQFTDDVRGLLDQLQSGDPVGREESLVQIDESYQALAGTIASDRDWVIHELELNRAEAGRIADAARFMVALVVPLTAVFVFRRSVRRKERQARLMQQLERQRQIARAKDDFIADLSHELRTPLTGISGFAATLLEMNVASDPELVTEFSTLIVREADELSRMIDDLLTAARARDDGLSFKLDKVDPSVEARKVLDTLRAQGVEMQVRIAHCEVAADPDRLRQVVRNLVSNALKHGAPPVEVTGRVEGDRYLLSVADGGPGVPADLEDRLFSRYIHEGRAPLLTGSVGLGLAIARLLTRRMGGELTYRRDEMTTFTIDLPLWIEPESAAEEVESHALTPANP